MKISEKAHKKAIKFLKETVNEDDPGVLFLLAEYHLGALLAGLPDKQRIKAASLIVDRAMEKCAQFDSATGRNIITPDFV